MSYQDIYGITEEEYNEAMAERDGLEAYAMNRRDADPDNAVMLWYYVEWYDSANWHPIAGPFLTYGSAHKIRRQLNTAEPRRYRIINVESHSLIPETNVYLQHIK